MVTLGYVTKWEEAKALPHETEKSIVDLLFEDIFVKLGVPREIVTNLGAQFTSNMVQYITTKY